MIKRYISEEEIKKRNERGRPIAFEKCYIISGDPDLQKDGVILCAESKIENNVKKNRLIFKKDDLTADIECVHTAVCQIVQNPESETGFEVVSTEGKPELKDLLTLEEHFFSIKSYANYLAEVGIEMMIKEAVEQKRETGKYPIDMNDSMINQITKAMEKISPDMRQKIKRITEITI